MSEKIAVHCPTKELWDKVLGKLKPRNGSNYDWHHGRGNSCICLDGSGFSDRDYQHKTGYTIKSAEEYLKEEGEEVEIKAVEIKAGDEVEILAVQDEKDHIGEIYRVRAVYPSGDVSVLVPGVSSWCYKKDRVKLANKQTKTTKKEEGNMNTVIEEVFEANKSKDEKVMQKWFGEEIDDTFTGKIFLTANKDTYLKEANKLEAEEKAEKDAAKKKK